MPIDLILYSTLGCHLCEQAEAMIAHTLQPKDYRLQVVEISDSAELVEKYGIRIPVVRREDLAQEIGWPFQPQDLLKFIALPR